MAPTILTRTAFPLVAAILLVGAAAATTSLTVTVGPASVHFESDDLPDFSPEDRDDEDDDGNGTRPPPDNGTGNDTFRMRVGPASQRVGPSEDATFLVELHAARDVVLRLDAKGSPGFHAEMGASEVALRKGENATVRLVVHTPPNASRGYVGVNATAADTGERHRAVVEVVVETPPTAQVELRLDPWIQNATPGETLTYVLRASSTLNRTIHLNVTSLPPGYEAELTRSSLFVGAGGESATNLTVRVPANATRGGEIRVLGWTAEGERDEAVAYVRMHEATTQPPPNGTEEAPASTAAAAPASTATPPVDAAPLVALPAAPPRVRGPAEAPVAWPALPMI